MAYTPIRLQKEKSGSSIVTSDSFNIYTESVPFKVIGDAKELYSNDWHDENGLDVYTDETNGLRMSAYDVEVRFVYKGLLNLASSKIKTFVSYLTGKDGSGVAMKMYDSYYKIGRQHVIFKSASDNAEIENIDKENALVKFSVSFQVNDPVTDITL